MEMIWAPSGSFRMGDLTGEGYDDEKPGREVQLSGYHLAVTEVTQGQWKKVMGSNPSYFKDDDRPVERVDWEEAMEFCRKLTEMERKAGRLPAGWAYTLPTEAQWENACRAGTTGDYAGDLDAMAWHIPNSGLKTHPVATKQPNAWGFYDMHGNVWEWCWDWYDDYDAGDTDNPEGPDSGSARVLRGGSWFSHASNCRSAYRNRSPPGNRNNFSRGFRVALSSRREP